MSGSFAPPSTNGITGFTTSLNTASPNNTVNVAQLLANVVSTNGDIVLSPKGTGAILAQVPDGTSTGGNKRGIYAVDLQTVRAANTQVASGSYSALIAGSNSTASGIYSTVLNAFSSTASGNYSAVLNAISSTASGASAIILGGSTNTASGSYSTVISGVANTASDNYSTVLNGNSNTASGSYSTVICGMNNTASGNHSVAFGRDATTNSIYGKIAFSSGDFSVIGDCQIGYQILRGGVTNTTPKKLTSDNLTAGTTNQIQLQNNRSMKIRCDILARSSTGLTKNIVAEAVLKRGASASTTTVSSPIYTTIYQDSGTENWTMVLSADTTNGCGAITFTIDSVSNVRCMAKVETVELIY